MTDKEVGARIEQMRQSRGLSQKELAAKAGLGLSTVQRAEDGNEGLSLKNLRKIAEGLSCDLEILLRSR